jgi:hypothetical protein
MSHRPPAPFSATSGKATNRARRVGPNRGITDTEVTVHTAAIQSADGRITSQPEPPLVHISSGRYQALILTSDQVRELAAVLLEAADEMDRWRNVASMQRRFGCEVCREARRHQTQESPMMRALTHKGRNGFRGMSLEAACRGHRVQCEPHHSRESGNTQP